MCVFQRDPGFVHLEFGGAFCLENLRYRVQQRTQPGCSLASQDTDSTNCGWKTCVALAILAIFGGFPNLDRYFKHFKIEKAFNLINLGPDLKFFGRKKPGETPNPRLLTLNPWNVKLASRRQSPMPSFHVLGVSPARNAKNEKWISGGKERKVWYQRLVLHTVILIILVVFSSTWCTWVRWVHWHMLQLYGVYRCISTCTYDNNINACKYKIDGYPHATYRVFQDMTASQHQTGRPVSKVNLGRRPWSSWCPFLLRGFGIQIFEMASSWSKDMV